RALSQIGRVLRFFSSRRRHTSFSRDWSSDVCSSDLFVKPQLSRKLGFNEFMEYDARMISYPNKQSSLLGDAFEAVIGAVYMDKRSEERRVGKECGSRGRSTNRKRKHH